MLNCEIFDRFAFRYFYTIKTLWVGKFAVKENIFFLYLRVHFAAKSSLCVCSALWYKIMRILEIENLTLGHL